MAESFIQVPPDSTGKKAHTNSRLISANTVEDEVTIPGEYHLLSAFAQCTSVAISGAANDHLMTLNAGAALNVRIRRIVVEQVAVAGAVNSLCIDVIRTTTGAPTGGTANGVQPHDSADTPTALSRSLPAVKGTVGVTLFRRRLPIVAALPPVNPLVLWEQSPFTKPIIIPAGLVNGIALNLVAAIAGATIDATIEFVETTFV